MRSMLNTLKQVDGVARSTEAGEPLESHGALDAETLCAVAAVAAGALDELKSKLGAGRLQRWYFVTEQHAYYVSERGHERLVASGDAVKNPEPTSKTLHSS